MEPSRKQPRLGLTQLHNDDFGKLNRQPEEPEESAVFGPCWLAVLRLVIRPGWCEGQEGDGHLASPSGLPSHCHFYKVRATLHSP